MNIQCVFLIYLSVLSTFLVIQATALTDADTEAPFGFASTLEALCADTDATANGDNAHDDEG